MLCEGRLRFRKIVHVSFSILLMCSMMVSPSALAKKENLPSGRFDYAEPGQEFSIQVPQNWVTEVGKQGFAVTLKPSSKAPRVKLPGGLIADPSLTVAVVKKPVMISKEALESTAKEIEENFLRVNGRETNFKIFQKNILTDLPNGRQALLYYVSFTTDGNEAGQAILVTGTDKVRYRVTLSDHRINFDRNLELYYPFMVSLDFKGLQNVSSSSLFLQGTNFVQWAVLVVLSGVVVGLIARFRRRSDALDDNPEVSISSVRSSTTAQIPTSVLPQSQIPLSRASGMDFGDDERSAQPQTASRDVAEESVFPQSMIGVANNQADGPALSEASEAVFTEKDLSAPPQSIPLSQVVDETSAPPDMKKRWQIFPNSKK